MSKKLVERNRKILKAHEDNPTIKLEDIGRAYKVNNRQRVHQVIKATREDRIAEDNTNAPEKPSEPHRSPLRSLLDKMVKFILGRG